MKTPLKKLIKDYSEEDAGYLWALQQPTSKIFDLFSQIYKSRIAK